MKKFQIVHISLCFVAVLICERADAQDYVLTAKGDSLTGEVKPLVYSTDKRVQIITADKKRTTLSLFEVKAYSQGAEIFHPVKSETGYVFMKLIKSGYLSLYGYQMDNQMRFDGLFLLKRDGARLAVPNLGFKKYIAKFLSDCEQVSNNVKDGRLTKRDLESIVDQYNACIEGRTFDHKKQIVKQETQTVNIGAWDSLEQGINALDFPEKNNALEMVSEVKKKIRQNEKIPNFLLEGLKNSLRETTLTEQLAHAINDLAN
jgi:hypothetical protein